MKIIKFGSDTKYRKQWFTGISFSHPAKMSLPLQLWVIDNFTKEGETILDPMAGSGTILVACSLGRHVITLELEDKFVQMQKDNWAKIQQRGCQLGYRMGTATILQGDARSLEGLLVDKCVFSPPYSNEHASALSEKTIREAERIHNRKYSRHSFTGGEDYSNSPNNISNLPYGEIDKIITSPPYGESVSVNQGGERESHQGKRAARLKKAGFDPKDYQGGIGRNLQQDWIYGNDPSNLGNLPYGSIDAVISSPPFFDNKSDWDRKSHAALEGESVTYSDEVGVGERRNIGNIHYYDQGEPLSHKYSRAQPETETYLSAMLLVYQNCFAVLKDGGLLILVTKNFIRNKQQVRLDMDTIKLCEQAGFTFQDRWYRELANQSLWRTIYYAKYSEVEPIKYEDVLVCQK